MAYTQQNSPLEVMTPLGKDKLLLVGFRGREAISQLFYFDLDLLAENQTEVAFERLLGEKITIRLRLPDGKDRYFNGICSRVSQGERDNTFTSYKMEVVPRVWLLTKKAQSRIFQQLSVDAILKKVLEGFDVSYEIQGKFHPRDYCVQYRETDFNFLSRLMEEEGIYYFFKHDTNSHKMVVANTPSSHSDMPHMNRIIFEEVIGGKRDEDRIYGWEKVQELRSGKYTLWDHCFELPHRHLEADATIKDSAAVGRVKHSLKVGGNDKLEIYDYPGEYAQRFDGVDRGGGDRSGDLKNIFEDNKRTVDIRMEQVTTPGLVIFGASNCRNFVSGHKFTLQKHFNADGEYLLVSLNHSAESSEFRSEEGGGGFDYENSFTCIPFAVPFRPPRFARRPIVQGTQTAVVVGPAGEEIFTDKYGRVKVQFHWDRQGNNDAESSCWLRVAQIWAGKRWGASFWPRIGQEVVVAFEEGDPDRPIVIGSVYNAEQMPPYLGDGPDPKHPNDNKLSGIKSNTTKGGEGFNELRFDDTKDKEQVFIHAERNMDVRVKASHMESVGGGRHLTVGGNFRQKVAKDKETIVDGEVKTKVKGKHNLSVDGEYVHFNTGKVYVTFDSGYYLHTNSKVLMEAVQEICLSVGPSFIKMTPAGIWITGPMVFINSGGAASTDMGLGCDLPVDPAGADDAKSGSKSAPDR